MPFLLNTFTEFVKVFRDFALILKYFSRIYTKSKLLRVYLHSLHTSLLHDMRNCGVTKSVVCRCGCGYTAYHTENSNHLDHNISIIWHKRSILVNHNATECNVSQEKKKLSRTYIRWGYRQKRNFVGYLYRYEKPTCRLVKTSQELREWLIFSTQHHRVLISSPLSPSQKQYETHRSREWKNAAVFANRISWRKVTITALTEVTAVSTTNLRHERKKSNKSLIIMLQKILYAGPKLTRNILTNSSPSPVRPEKPGQT